MSTVYVKIPSFSSGSGVQSVTGLDTDNTDPFNPIVQISVDGVSITGAGTPGDPLVATDSLFDNLTALVDPSVNDDSGLGYAVGSLWYNVTNNTFWVCQNNSSGAAVWSMVLTGLGKSNMNSASNPTVNDDGLDGYKVGSLWFNNSTQTLYVLQNPATGAAVWTSLGGGSGTVTSVGTGFGLTGGTITAAGTISLDATDANGFLYSDGAASLSFTGINTDSTITGDGTIGSPLHANIGPILITVSDLVALMQSGTVVPGGLYQITDSTQASLINVRGESANRISEIGTAFFWNADFQAVGDYSDVPGFGVQLAQWNAELEQITVNYVSLAGGNFARGQTITGLTSGATAVVISDDTVSSLQCYITSAGTAFSVAETIDNGGGVTADVDTIVPTTINDGDVVIWSGGHHQVLDNTKFNGTNPTTNTDAYSAILPTTPENGYIGVWDTIQYDLVESPGIGTIHDWIVWREDTRANHVGASWLYEQQAGMGVNIITLFQWGNDRVFGNHCQEAYINCLNNYGYVKENPEVSDFSAVEIGEQTGNFFGNSFTTASSFLGTYSAAEISNNKVSNTAQIQCDYRSRGQISGCVIANNGAVVANGYVDSFQLCNVLYQGMDLTTVGSAVFNTLSYAYSDFRTSFDITGLTVLDVSTKPWAGIITVTSSNATETIDEMEVNGSGTFDRTIYPEDGLTLTVEATPVASAANNDIVLEGGVDVVLTGRSDAGLSDFIVLRTQNPGNEIHRQVIASVLG